MKYHFTVSANVTIDAFNVAQATRVAKAHIKVIGACIGTGGWTDKGRGTPYEITVGKPTVRREAK